jgi:hypothetical protein
MWTDVVIGKASLIGICSKCGQPTTGSYDSDEYEDEESLIMGCVGCGAEFICEIPSDEYFKVRLHQKLKRRSKNENKPKSK